MLGPGHQPLSHRRGQDMRPVPCVIGGIPYQMLREPALPDSPFAAFFAPFEMTVAQPWRLGQMTAENSFHPAQTSGEIIIALRQGDDHQHLRRQDNHVTENEGLRLKRSTHCHPQKPNLPDQKIGAPVL